MNKKIIALLSVVVVVVFLGVFIGSPYYFASSIKSAAKSGDEKKLSSYIDYPKLKENFKIALKVSFMENMKKQGKDNKEEIANFESPFMKMLIDSMAEAIIAPTNIAALINGQPVTVDPSQHEGKKIKTQVGKAGDKKVDVKFAYTGPNSFAINILTEGSEKPLKLIMKRHMLFGWKLGDIAL